MGRLLLRVTGFFVVIGVIAAAIWIMKQGDLPMSPPPKLTKTLPDPPDSFISIPIEIPLDTLKDSLLKAAPTQPIADGKTAPFNSAIVGIQLVKQIKVQTIHDWIEEKHHTERRIAAWVLLGPIWHTVEVIDKIPHHDVAYKVVDEGTSFTGNVVDHITTPIERTFNVTNTVHYKASFKNIEGLSLQGNQLSATFVFTYALAADANLPLGVTAKGVLSATGETTVSVNATVTMENNAALKVVFADHGIKPEVRKLEIPGIPVNLAKLIPLDPTVLLTEKTLDLALKALPLGSIGQSILDSHASDLTFGPRIAAAIKQQSQPLKLGKDVFLFVQPKQLCIGSPRGVTIQSRQYLRLPIAVTGSTRVVFSEIAPPSTIAPADLSIVTLDEASPDARLQLVGDISVDKCLGAIDSAAQQFWNKNVYSTYGLSLGPSQIWESTGDRIVVVLPIRKSGSQDDYVRLSVWGAPRIVEEAGTAGMSKLGTHLKELVVDDLDWTEESKNWLINKAAWIAHDELRDLLRQNTKVSLDSINSQIDAHSQVVHDAGNVLVAFDLTSYRLDSFMIQDGFVRVVINANGQPYIKFK